LLVWSGEIRVVPGREPGVPARRVLQLVGLPRPRDRDHADSGREVRHREVLETPARTDPQPGDKERPVADVEAEDDVEPERRPDEPRRRDRRGRPDVAEVEALLQTPAELAVEDPQDDRHLRPARTEAVADGQTRLDVRQVV